MVEWWQLQGNTTKPNNSLGMELSGSQITPGGSDTHRRSEGKKTDPSLPYGDES